MLRGFVKKKVESYTLGEQLKRMRSEGRITIHEVSRETKVPVKYLEMIEEERYESLPPDVYVKGFLRSYADFLGVDRKKLINLYSRERDIKNNINGNGKPKNPTKNKRVTNFVVTPKIFTAAVVILVILGGFLYLYNEIGRFAAIPRLVLTQPASNEENIDGNSITVVGFTDEDAKLTINGQPVVVNDKGEFRENILLQKGLNTLSIKSVNRFNKEATQVVNVKSNYDNSQTASDNNGDSIVSSADGSGEVSGEQNSKNETGVSVAVRVESLPTWLSVESDGNLIYSGTMLPEAVQEFKGDKEVRITSGKANQTMIKVNGKGEKKLADDPGIVRDVLFTPKD
jgi:cytoskeletal protein RodZ